MYLTSDGKYSKGTNPPMFKPREFGGGNKKHPKKNQNNNTKHCAFKKLVVHQQKFECKHNKVKGDGCLFKNHQVYF